MSSETSRYLKFGGATVVILLALGYLAYTGVQESKSYYVTIKELRGMGDSAHTKRLRVAGNVQPGSIKRNGTKVEFVSDRERSNSCRSRTAAPSLRPILSRTIPRRWPMEVSDAMASSMLSNCKPSAPRSTRRNSRERPPLEDLRMRPRRA